MLTDTLLRCCPKPPKAKRGIFFTNTQVSPPITSSAVTSVTYRQRRVFFTIHPYVRCMRGQYVSCIACPFASAGIITSAERIEQASASAKAAANGKKAARAFPCRYRKGKSTTAVVSVDPSTAGTMRIATSARASAVSGMPRSRSTTTSPFCTSTPIPMPRPASVSMFAGILRRKSPSAVPAIAMAALPITNAMARTFLNAISSTIATAAKAMPLRTKRSVSCSSNSTDSSDVICQRNPAASSGPNARSAVRTPSAVLIASAPASRVTVSARAVFPFTR